MSGYAGRDTGWLVETWARREPDRPFLVWAPFDEPARTWTRAEFAEAVARVASGLRARGLGPGDRLGLVLPNRPEFLLAWCAATSLGAVAVCLNPGLSRDELGYALGHSEVTLVVAEPDRAEDVAVVRPEARVLPTGPHGGPDGFDVLLGSEVEPRPRPAGPAAPASIQYTSGTTARPKGVVWTQANCLWAGQVGAGHQGLGPSDVNLVHLPLFHTNALSYSFLSSLWSGGTLVLTPKFSASRFWDVSLAHGVTWTSVVSFCLRALDGREVPERHRYRGWGNSAVVAPAPVTGGVPVLGWFGMTETVSHPIVSELLHPGSPGAMGRAAPEYGVSLTDESGAPLAPGEVGELRVHGRRGISLFAEYLHAPEQTRAAFDEQGRFRTGDRVRCDEHGEWWFVERDKDVLKVGGENIGAPEIERVLLGAPGVREAVVVGRPDPMLGEVPVAFVTARPGERVAAAEVAARCELLLADFKRPREIRVVEELPRSTLDKVAKAALREQLRRETEEGRG
ncbi:AMP-binding protein [Nocardioides nitrophenolicus]|uniref:AMP-binding protein n=1 Tax=Nocardioides nitrophenolicus TaxID=60489 RepID=UPI0019561F3C|nr:AMP-binding protein [Nocardioides nitrophenolicus]MBM7516497.1 crotonobetaine/carnitine-CoA ligase [Nocardioides nitrophenolicus]